MVIKLKKKFADKHLDEFINSIYLNHKHNPGDRYKFDLTDIEFIGNQELLLLTALLKTFFESGVEFEVEFFKKGVPTSDINIRVKRQIIQIWVVWKLWKVIPNDDYERYFGVDIKTIERLQDEIEYYPSLSEIFRGHGITPFISLQHIDNYTQSDVHKLIQPIYKLNSVIENLLRKHNCHHPFTSNALSSIITEELYLNFLDHSTHSSFEGLIQIACMSISFQPAIDVGSEEESQKIVAYNFETENLLEAKGFFFDQAKNRFRNRPYIEFSFVDFGEGILNTLAGQYKTSVETKSNEDYENEILRFAFNHNSSRHPILNAKGEYDKYIPRGLFDILTLVRRYSGLLIVRSNSGKILFDFTNTNDVGNAFKRIERENQYFPGTLISIYIPAIKDVNKLNLTSIKPDFEFSKVKPQDKKYVSVNTLVAPDVSKDRLYNELLNNLRREISNYHLPSLLFVSFKGCEFERDLIKKTIYFLLTDYEINVRNNVVILNSPPGEVIKEIASELPLLNEAIRNFKIHPLPIIDFDINTEDVNVTWLGIYDDLDKYKLGDLLYEQYSIAKSDFVEPSNVSGQLNEFDGLGNLISNFPTRTNVVAFFRAENEISTSKLIENLLGKHNCFTTSDGKHLYLCNGHYYQEQYLEISNLVNDKNDCNILTQLLHAKLTVKLGALKNYKFLGISTASHKLLRSLSSQGLLSVNGFKSYENYDDFEREVIIDLAHCKEKIILICDVLSTGFLTGLVDKKLQTMGLKIDHVAVVVSIYDISFSRSKDFNDSFGNKCTSLFDKPIRKYEAAELKGEISKRKIIRVNPYTNIPITLSLEDTKYKDSVIFHSSVQYDTASDEITISNKFLDRIDQESIQVGFYKFNNVIHPYFFDTSSILADFNEDMLRDIFRQIGELKFKKNNLQVFYPKNSGIEHFDFNKLKTVLNNYSIAEIELERFSTSEGWRFPHNTNFLSNKVKGSFCFILDDGSCSGDSLIQMIDEISFYDADEIVLLCIIGRVNDHKREFFSRLSHIKVRGEKTIRMAIYFACHWHIPTYYIDENPTIKEINWLQELIRFQNTPPNIRHIAKKVLKELTPKNPNSYTDYKYLPKYRSDKKKIPKKEILLVREELGKVIGYRLYKESFEFFDCFTKKYRVKKVSASRYKEIELLCATFIYEPYLYDRLNAILPDVVQQIEKFVEILIFEDPRLYDMLTYEWDKIDIVHLFFIVFKNEKLLATLNEDQFNKLIDFIEKKETAVNYVLYKLLSYFPLNAGQLEKKEYDVSIKTLLSRLIDRPSANREIRRFYNFISTLPSRDDFNSQLGVLIDNYNKQKDRHYHNEKISFDHNISHFLALLRSLMFSIAGGSELEGTKIALLIERWFDIQDFINPILSFSSTFKEFLLPYPYFGLIDKVESGHFSLRNMFGYNEEVIFSLTPIFKDLEKLKAVEGNILRIQTNFKHGSDFHKLISKRRSNLKNLVSGINQDMESTGASVNVSGMALLESTYEIDIPEIYAENLIRKELNINLKNHGKCDKTSRIQIDIRKTAHATIEVSIVNEISDNSTSSTGEGIKCLNLLSQSRLFGFKYKASHIQDFFHQTMTFELR